MVIQYRDVQNTELFAGIPAERLAPVLTATCRRRYARGEIVAVPEAKE